MNSAPEHSRLRFASIVVGVDGSPESLFALDLAAAVGTPNQATLRVVHVRPTPMSRGLGPDASVEYAQAVDELDQAITTEAAIRLAGYSGTWSVTIRSGHIGRELLAEADGVDADLIVLGHSSHGTVHDAVLGSTAASTVHHSTRSVLVAVPPT